MQITIDSTKDDKEDIQKAIEILNHFLNKQPKASVIMNKPIQQSKEQIQQNIQRLQIQKLQIQKTAEQPGQKLAEQSVHKQIRTERETPRQELKKIDPDLNNITVNNIHLKSRAIANTPETEDFLNKMLEEINETDEIESEDQITKTEKEVQRVSFGSTEIIKHEKTKEPEEDPEFKFDDLEKY